MSVGKAIIWGVVAIIILGATINDWATYNTLDKIFMTALIGLFSVESYLEAKD